MKASDRQKREGGGDFSDRFLRELLNRSPDFSRGEARVTFEVGRGLLIEGVRNVVEYGEQRLIIATFSQSVVIEGSRLCICSMMGDSLVICGCVASVQFL